MDRLVIVLIFTSFVGIALIYVAALNTQPDTVELGSVNGELLGRTVTTEGYIKSETMNENGHLFLTITDGKKLMQVPIFSSVMQNLNVDDFKKGSNIRVTGLVDQYKNQIQIIPRKSNDVVLGKLK